MPFTGLPTTIGVRFVSINDTIVLNRTSSLSPAPAGFLTGYSDYPLQLGIWALRSYVNSTNGIILDCRITVRVRDMEPPVVTCGNVLLNTDPGLPYATYNWSRNATATDNVGVYNSTCFGGPSNNRFHFNLTTNTTINCTARDTSGNSNWCRYTVAVRDPERPVITCPTVLQGNTTSRLPVGLLVNASVNATDNYAVASIVCVPGLKSNFSLGTTNASCTATDFAGNTASCFVPVVIQDNEPPRLTCLNQSYPSSPLGPNTTTMVSVSVTDNSQQPVAVSCSPGGLPNATLFQLGRTLVSCQASDTSFNSASCNFFVTVSTT